VLRVMGLANRPGFGRYHEVLNRARWDARDVARRLLLHLLAVLLPNGEVVIGIDDTIERRWGGKIKARGIYRDAVRSSYGHFVKTSGLRWLSLAVMVPVPFAERRWALPFLTVLAPSARWSEAQGKAAQGSDRLGKAGDTANQTLAAESPHCYGRRRRFRGLGTHRRGAPARLFDHQAASRRQLIPSRDDP
jgi:DDE superfamily endonuclease